MRTSFPLITISLALALCTAAAAQGSDQDRNHRNGNPGGNRPAGTQRAEHRPASAPATHFNQSHHDAYRGAAIQHHEDRGRDARSVWGRHDPRPSYWVGHMPPPRRHEWQSWRPSLRHSWIPGCWRWDLGYRHWVWVDGYWCLPPREHVVYMAPRYEQSGGDVVCVEGGWVEE
jgi:hypothetical protein